MRSARMLIVDRGNGNKARDDALRALDALLPSHWHIIGNIPPSPIPNAERPGSTEPFDALVIGEKSISVVNIVNEPGRVRVRIGKPYEVDGEEVAWAAGKPSSLRDFNTEVHKLCLLLRDRLDIDPYRVAGKMIWVGATQIDHESSATREEVTDIEQFVELAVTRDERMLLGPLSKQQVESIAGYFLTTQQKGQEAGSSAPDGWGESAEDFLISSGEARPGAGAAQRALPATVQAPATTAMVRSSLGGMARCRCRRCTASTTGQRGRITSVPRRRRYLLRRTGAERARFGCGLAAAGCSRWGPPRQPW